MELNSKAEKEKYLLNDLFVKVEKNNDVHFILKNNKKEKYLLATLIDYDYSGDVEYFLTTHNYFIKYCNKYNLDYIILIGKENQDFAHLMYEKFRLKELLDDYERILFVDADVLILDHAKNIFDIVPENCLGMFNERNHVRHENSWPMAHWVESYQQILKANNIVDDYDVKKDWDDKYYNAGTIVLSKEHGFIFEDEIANRMYDHCNEQGWINYLISKHKLKVHDIGVEFSGLFTIDIMQQPYYFDEMCNCNFIHFVFHNKLPRLLKFEEYYKNKKNLNLLDSAGI